MKGNFNGPKEVVMAVFLYVAGMQWNLVVCPHQIDLGEEATTREVVGIIVDVSDGMTVGESSGIKSSIFTAWALTVVLLGHDMESQ
jgi:hypothetical protein